MLTARSTRNLARFVAGLCCVAAPARAENLPVTVDCPAWHPESASQVEARVRATLLAESLTAEWVTVRCDLGDSVSVSVASAFGEETRLVERQSARIEDDVVVTVELALREIMNRVPSAQPATPTAPTATAPTGDPPPSPQPPIGANASPPPTRWVPAAPAAPARPVLTGDAQSAIELSLSPAVARWSDHWALGATFGLSVSGERIVYGLSLGGASAINEPEAFDVREWLGNAHVGLELPELARLRAVLAAGGSLLVATPASGISPSSGTLLSALSVELTLARPFWFGAFGISPGFGVRLFSARRNVRVDAREELAVPLFTPQASLAFIYCHD